jgi:hypothetical protein
MRSDHDFTRSRSNPYAKQPNWRIAIDLDATTVDYFQELGQELGLPYENLLSLYLQDCAARKYRIGLQSPPVSWRAGVI